MISIVPFEASYSKAVTSIEMQCFNSPWGLESLMRTLTGPRSIALMALMDGKAVGYAAALVIPPEAEVLKVAVLPQRRGTGIGRRLAEELIARLSRTGARTLHLEVRESNRAARILYETCGFRQVGVRSGYYMSPPEDAVLMRRDL